MLATRSDTSMMRSFANGGSSLTGLEAISNGVSAFRPPTGRNARKTLVVMSCLLGVLVGGVSWLAHETHAVPYLIGSPTVISQVAQAVFGSSLAGHLLYLMVQLATMLILYTGVATGGTLCAGDDAIELAWYPLDQLPDDLAFASHRQALTEMIERLARA